MRLQNLEKETLRKRDTTSDKPVTLKKNDRRAKTFYPTLDRIGETHEAATILFRRLGDPNKESQGRHVGCMVARATISLAKERNKELSGRKRPVRV